MLLRIELRFVLYKKTAFEPNMWLFLPNSYQNWDFCLYVIKYSKIGNLSEGEFVIIDCISIQNTYNIKKATD